MHVYSIITILKYPKHGSSLITAVDSEVAVENLEVVASPDEEVHRLAPVLQEVVAFLGEEVGELASQAWEELVDHASLEEGGQASQVVGYIEEEAFDNAQEELNQVLIREGTALGEVGLSEASVVAHFEVGILASADQVAALQVHLGKSSQELRTEEQGLVVERSEAASCLELDHQHHELDQPDQAEHEQEVRLEYPVQRLGQDQNQPRQRHSWTWHVTLQEGEGLQQSWKSTLHL